MDMIGPWTIEVGDRTEKFTLMIIDLITNLVETVCVTNKTSAAITAQFVNVQLTCYMSCLHDHTVKHPLLCDQSSLYPCGFFPWFPHTSNAMHQTIQYPCGLLQGFHHVQQYQSIIPCLFKGRWVRKYLYPNHHSWNRSCNQTTCCHCWEEKSN
jgi:hypothetical protein